MPESPKLALLAQEVLAGAATPTELLECNEETQQQLRLEQQRMREVLLKSPEAVRHSCRMEIADADESFDDFRQLAQGVTRYARDFDADQLRELVEGLQTAALRLEIDLLRLDEALWSARGPTTLGGLNRLLAVTELDDAYVCVELEVGRWRGDLAHHPAPIRERVRAFARDYLSWLEEVPKQSDQLDAWLDEGAELGMEFAPLDVLFLWRNHGGGPTPYRSLNLAANSVWLRADKHVDPALSDFCLEQFEHEVQDLVARTRPAQEQGSEEQQQHLQELDGICQDLLDVVAQLRRWNVRGTEASLPPLRQLLLELGSEYQQLVQAFPSDPEPDLDS